MVDAPDLKSGVLGREGSSPSPGTRASIPSLVPCFVAIVTIASVSGEALRGQLDLLLLTSIGAGAKHGYAIAKELRLASHGAFDLPDGTIYPALHRLSAAGLLTSEWSEGGRRRRLYTLTPQGREALERERASWEQFERGVRGVLTLKPRR